MKLTHVLYGLGQYSSYILVLLAVALILKAGIIASVYLACIILIGAHGSSTQAPWVQWVTWFMTSFYGYVWSVK